MMSLPDSKAEQWGDEARERFRKAGHALSSAVRAHGEVLLALTGRAEEISAIFDANDRLAEAAAAYSSAQFDFTGTFPKWELPDLHCENDFTSVDDVDLPPVGRLSVLRRADYRVVDAAELVRAGRDAYRHAWPSDTAADAVSSVSGVGRAVYELLHAVGERAMADAPGIAPVGSVTWVIEPNELLDEQDPDQHMESPFDLNLPVRVLHRHEDGAD